MKKILVISVALLFITLGCKEEEYKVDFSKDALKVSFKNSKLTIKNKSNYPIVLDSIKKDDKVIASFIDYKYGSYIKYQDEVILNTKDSNNQYIVINSILLPKKEKSIPLKLSKQDEIEIVLYPLTFQFIADNIYFKSEDYSDMESRYKLYSKDEIKSLNLPFIEKNVEEINEISGIMIYVNEFNSLDDYVEEITYKYEE